MKEIKYMDRKTGNVLKEKVPGAGWLKWLYHNPAGKLALDMLVKRKFISRWYGWLMDTPSSRNRITEFVRDLDIDMNEILKPLDQFSSFNDFFTRELKPGCRSVDLNSESIVSPADGKITAFADMDALHTFFVKGQEFSLDSFLQDRMLSKKYAGGAMMIIRLAPADYHRFHFPAEGRTTLTRQIDGDYCSVSPYAVKDRMRIYWENKREYSELRTETAGDILMCEVGATMVGSIVQKYIPDTITGKGQLKGWFKFGGSTVILLFEKDKIRVDEDIIRNTISGYETTVKVGERIALALG
ncbi:phosphatidylserine decarboxylase [Maridesulfovibrio sp.]|uniref:phosphatidylserine decarboxylase n=1 Tax=Maridesulfovibrio sp. TaxID=2795000 RepID=UPI002A189DF6|nr:phosphatidylserine decarboxylase [Maridesulfovibrio sp.]